ncbi:hypothetical protein GYMLUDRAFT_166803 [Collybiopsis luxurians FD-317 M1]|uniref:Unplaced genomic scaffold GYMLUscaffold_24, whole genome shotgun sequence n=1 Tax=Collybiopsis luxurians FD-317 M1 TaxID=944289 RepID=A0A0D0CY67_9AGAR|nr:hypothetical protein GYMLUDRAFT_166803 [Collybiopsis luxurians FD-317 M1]
MAGSEPPSGVVAGILKEEGDLLFRESKYVEAIAKYTEALRVGGDNAILYSNRSLCRFKLRQ